MHKSWTKNCNSPVIFSLNGNYGESITSHMWLNYSFPSKCKTQILSQKTYFLKLCGSFLVHDLFDYFSVFYTIKHYHHWNSFPLACINIYILIISSMPSSSLCFQHNIIFLLLLPEVCWFSQHTGTRIWPFHYSSTCQKPAWVKLQENAPFYLKF